MKSIGTWVNDHSSLLGCEFFLIEYHASPFWIRGMRLGLLLWAVLQLKGMNLRDEFECFLQSSMFIRSPDITSCVFSYLYQWFSHLKPCIRGRLEAKLQISCASNVVWDLQHWIVTSWSYLHPSDASPADPLLLISCCWSYLHPWRLPHWQRENKDTSIKFSRPLWHSEAEAAAR